MLRWLGWRTRSGCFDTIFTIQHDGVVTEWRLIVFLKAPRVGEVKTRLGLETGMENALGIYRQLLDSLLENLKSFRGVELRVTPNDGGEEIQGWVRPGWVVRKQGTGGLTERLVAAFAEAFASGAERVVVIGSDCPEVTIEDIETAWEALATNDLVLGPAVDGGYWLVGLRRALPEIFSGIAWSSDRVLEKTLQIARQSGLKTHLLRTLNDVDTFADWERFQHSRGGDANGDLSDSGAAEPR
jgi:uncharacterized protein